MTPAGPVLPWRLAIAAVVVFPFLGPPAIALAAGVPLAVLGLFVLGPGGVLYYFMLMGWWLPGLYALLALPYFLTGVVVALAALVIRRSSLVIALIATELAFCAYLAFCYLVYGRIVVLAYDYANVASMLRSPGSAVGILAGAGACWFVIRHLAPRPGEGAAQPSRWERAATAGVMIAGVAGLAAMLTQGARQPGIAWKECSEGGWDERIQGCTVIIRRGTDEPVERRLTAYMRRAGAYADRRDFTSAIADYTEAIRLDPSHAPAYAGRGLSHAGQGAHDRTIADIDMALKLDPNLFGEGAYRLFRARGLAHFHRGEFDRAVADHTEEIRLVPRFADGLLHRAAAHRASKDDARALADFADAIRIEPYRPAGYIGRGSIYLAQGDTDRALADFDEAIKRLPNHRLTAPAYRMRGEILERRGDVAGALAAYEMAVSLDPSDKIALAGRDRLRAAPAR